MGQYIDKSELVKEIKRQILAIDTIPKTTETQISVLSGNKVILTKLLSFLNTLETKEVVAEQEGICNGILNTIIGDTTWHLKIPLDKAGLKHGDKVKIFITKEK